MSLTNEQILKLRQQYNINPVEAPTKSTIKNGPKNSFTGKAIDFIKDAGQDIKQTGSALKKTITDTIDDVKDVRGALERGEQGNIRSIAQGAGILAGGVSKAIGNVVTGAAKVALPEETEKSVKSGLEMVAKPIVESDTVKNIISKYESLDADKKRDIDAVLGIGSLAAEFTGLGLGKKVASAGIKTGTEALETGLEAVGSGVKKVVTSTKEGVENTLGSTIKPENIMQRVARIPKGAQAKFEKTAGESVGEYLTKRDIYGNSEEISKQLYDRFSNSRNTADDALAKLPGNFQAKPIETALDELFAKETRVSSPGALSKDFKRVRELRNKYQSGGLTMPEINEAKRLYERNVRLDFVKQNLPEGVARSSNIDSALREWQFGQAEKLGLKNLPDINRETRLARELLDALGKEAAGAAGNNAIPLTDIILLASGEPSVIAGFFGKKIIGSKKIQSAIAKKLYKGDRVEAPKAKFETPKKSLEDFLKKN